MPDVHDSAVEIVSFSAVSAFASRPWIVSSFSPYKLSPSLFLISNLTAYVLNILWVFERGRHRWWVEVGLFYAVSGISWVVGSVLQTLLIGGWGLSTTVAFGANVVASMSINFVLRKFWVFKG